MDKNSTKTMIAKNVQTGILKFFGACLALAAVAFVAVTVFKLTPMNLIFAVGLLLCPLMHVWMMRDGKHKH